MRGLLALALCGSLLVSECSHNSFDYFVPGRLISPPPVLALEEAAIEEIEGICFFYFENGEMSNFGFYHPENYSEDKWIRVEAEDWSKDKKFDLVTIAREDYSKETGSSKISFTRGISGGRTARVFELVQRLYSEFMDLKESEEFYRRNQKNIEELCSINPDTWIMK